MKICTIDIFPINILFAINIIAYLELFNVIYNIKFKHHNFHKKFFFNLINVSLRLEFVRQFLLWNIVLQVWSFSKEFCLNKFLWKRKRRSLEYYNGIVIALSFEIVFRTKERILYAKIDLKYKLDPLPFILKNKKLNYSVLNFQSYPFTDWDYY